MPLTWNVQPYQFLKDLRENYTQTVVRATQNSSARLASEAKKWMKENAPWKDRSEEERAKRGVTTPHARELLTAFVIRDKEDYDKYRQGKSEASGADYDLLKTLNADRRAKLAEANAQLRRYQLGYDPLQMAKVDLFDLNQDRASTVDYKKRKKQSLPPLEGHHETAFLMRRYYRHIELQNDYPTLAKKLKRKIRTQKQYKPLKAVPKGLSEVADFERAWKGQRKPVVEVKFTYGSYLTYAIWLEIANGGRYNIIARTLDHWGPKFLYEIKRISTLKQYRDKIAVQVPVKTEEEKFAAHVRDYEMDRGIDYEPWGPERQRRRKFRRKYWTEEAKQTRRESKVLNDVRQTTESKGRATVYREPEPIPTFNPNRLTRR